MIHKTRIKTLKIYLTIILVDKPKNASSIVVAAYVANLNPQAAGHEVGNGILLDPGFRPLAGASRGLLQPRQRAGEPAKTEQVDGFWMPKTRAILALKRLNFLSVYLSPAIVWENLIV